MSGGRRAGAPVFRAQVAAVEVGGDERDGPMFGALRFARQLRARGAGEAAAAQRAAEVFRVEAEEIARVLGWAGGLSTLRRDSSLALLRRRGGRRG